MDSPRPISHISTQTLLGLPTSSALFHSSTVHNRHTHTYLRSASGITAATEQSMSHRSSISSDTKNRPSDVSSRTTIARTDPASFTLQDVQSFVYRYLYVQYGRTLPLTTFFSTPTKPKPGSKYSPPKWEHWLRLALFCKVPGPSPGICRDLKALKGVMERAGLDAGLLDPLLANLRDGEGCFGRTAGSHAHGLLVRNGRLQDLAATLLAERRLVEGLWPLRGDYYDVMDEALICFGTVKLMLRDFLDPSDRRGPQVHRWVYDETVRWFSELDSPTKFKLNARARKMTMRASNSHTKGNLSGESEKLVQEKSLTSALSQALREALVRTAELQKRGQNPEEKDISDDTDVHPVFRASSPPLETIASLDGNLDPRRSAQHKFNVRIPVPIATLWEGVPVSTLPIEATRMLRCFCGCLHEISLSIDMPPLSPELEQGCLKIQSGTGKFVRRTGSGRHVLAKRNSLASAVGSLKAVGSIGSLRRFAGSPPSSGSMIRREGKRAFCDGEEDEKIGKGEGEDSGMEGV